MEKKKVFVYLSILVTMISWSMSYIWIKIVYRYYNPTSTVFLRLLMASVFLYIFVRWTKKLQEIRTGDFKYLILMSLFHPFLYFLGESYSLKFVSPTVAAVITSTIPLFVPVAAYWLLREKLSRLNILGLAVSFLGILPVIIKEDFSLAASPLGLLLLFMAVGAGVGYTTSVRKLTSAYSPLTIVTYQNILGTLWFFPLFLLVDWQPFLQARPAAEAVVSLVMLALLASALAFILFAYAIREIGASRASVFSNSIPVFTALLSWFFLKEQLTWRMLLGVFVVITGLFISQIKKKKDTAS